MSGDFVTLLGAEDVRRAGHEMASSAETIRQSVAHLCEELHRSCLRMEEALDRMEALQKRSEGQ